MKYHYAAIEREYGSGGTEIGKKITEAGQIPSYGSEILRLVSEKLNIDPDRIEKYEEKASSSLLYSIFLAKQINEGEVEDLSREGRVYLEEQRMIQSLAAKGSAVFVGRCAENALLARNDVLKVFIRADKKLRMQRAVESYGINPAEVDAVVRRFDKKRGNYYATNTGKSWNDASNYHMVLDSGKLGTETCARIILAAMNG